MRRLPVWFWAAYLMATHSNGISARQLQRQLGLGSYRSAWLLCGKLRRGMVAPGRPPLTGLVEIDETEIPCRSTHDPLGGGGGRSHQGKMLVAGAVEIQDGGPGRVRLAAVSDYSAKSLHPFIAGHLAPGALAKTESWSAYPGAPGVSHHPHVIGRMAAHVVLPGVHRIFQSQSLGAGRLSRPAPPAPANLSRRVRLSLQSPSDPARRIPLPSRSHDPTPAAHLQHADHTGSTGISLNEKISLAFMFLLSAIQKFGDYPVDAGKV